MNTPPELFVVLDLECQDASERRGRVFPTLDEAISSARDLLRRASASAPAEAADSVSCLPPDLWAHVTDNILILKVTPHECSVLDAHRLLSLKLETADA